MTRVSDGYDQRTLHRLLIYNLVYFKIDCICEYLKKLIISFFNKPVYSTN